MIFLLNQNKDGYSFDAFGKILTINPNSLEYVSGRIYEFLVQADYHGQLVFQIIRVVVEDQEFVPVISLEY